MSPRRRSVLALSLSLVWAGGCRAGALVIGEAESADGGLTLPDGGGGGSDGAGDVELDAAPTFVDGGDGGERDCVSLGGSCVPNTSVCLRPSAASCGTSALICCLPDCPVFQNPPPLCDGGPTARLFSKTGCDVGLACAPLDCNAAGGTCAAPTACPLSQRGDASSYLCNNPASPADVCCLP
ncbi:MAG: hypothetical protein IPG50_19515 [Myxococcales bacterium]|nr:hypothetical protein [Myxococcales bacterium]